MCERADFGKGSEVLSNVHVRVFKGSGISISLLFHNYFSVLCQPPFMHLMCEPTKILREANTTCLWMTQYNVNSIHVGTLHAGK